MFMKTKVLVLVACLFVVCGLSLSAFAQAGPDPTPRCDWFFGEFDAGANVMLFGDGSGWSSTGGPGEWIEYPDVPGLPWWNQWFYDHPPDPFRIKEIEYFIHLEPVGIVVPTLVEIAINYSTIDYPETGPGGAPPLPPDEPFIRRVPIVDPTGAPVIELIPGLPIVLEGELVIPELNPEWISIDIRAVDLTQPGQIVLIDGVICHACVPLPAAAWAGIVLLGGLGGIRLFRKR
jgi:hypothetical protein